MDFEKEVTESTQTNNDMIETNVKKALECLDISFDEQMTIEELALDLNNKTTNEVIDSSVDDITDKSGTSVGLNILNESSVDSYSTVTTKKVKSEHNFLTTSNTIDVSNEVSISDCVSSLESSTIGSPESKSKKKCDVINSEINYVNAVLSETLGKPVINRYPLKYRWQLWFWRADQGVKVVWEEALQQVCRPFATIEDFWRLYHHIICVQQLVPPSDYCVFKEGIKPMWEDVHNINGGKWILEFPKGFNCESNSHLDEIWLEVLLCLIGEGFNDYGEEICGAVVNVRSKEDRISVWTANANKSVANLKMGEILKMRTGYEGKLKYEAHSTSQEIAVAKETVVKPKRFITTKPIRRSCIF